MFMRNSFMQELQQSMTHNAVPIRLEEVANGIVHPLTKETITTYTKFINEPLL